MKKLGCFVFAALFAYVITQIYHAISGSIFWKFWIDQFYYGSENDGMLNVFLLLCAAFSIPLFFGVVKGAWREFSEPSQPTKQNHIPYDETELPEMKEHRQWKEAHGVISEGSITHWTDKKGRPRFSMGYSSSKFIGQLERDAIWNDKTKNWEWADKDYRWAEESHE